MTIEQKIRRLYKRYNKENRHKDIIKYPYRDMPESIRWDLKIEFHKRMTQYLRVVHINQVDYLRDELIRRADEAECLTSESRYIRECKKWYIDNWWKYKELKW